MATPKDSQRFTEIEYCLSRYFHTNILPIMKREKDALGSAQADEMKKHGSSISGALRSAATNDVDSSLLYLRATGNECSKTAEDYVVTCKNAVAGNDNIQKDMQRIACDWRTAVIGEIGRERYDLLSQKLGADLALAYIDHRLEQMMVDRMVREQMPKSSFDYIVKKGASGSLFGLANEVMNSSLESEIAKRGEAAYKPSKSERYTARGVSAAADIVSFGGVYSWGSLTKIAGAEIVFAGLESVLDKNAAKGPTVDEVLSQAIFGDTVNRFDVFRKDSLKIMEHENDYLQTVNQGLSLKMNLLTEKPLYQPSRFETMSQSFKTNLFPFSSAIEPKPERDPSIPLLVVPGQEEEFLEMQKKNEVPTPPQETQSESPQIQTPSVETPLVEETNQASWAGWLQSFGLDNISDVGRNLPYVIAMLPDMLVGLLTGKTQSIGLKKDMVPIASILMGMFVSNPLLKMVMIGMGGANLFNKVGHEAIERNTDAPQRQYLQYADEELNPRILNPVIRGNILVATIDGVPCSVTIPDNAAEALATGALPLNTLANAILARHDSMRDTERDNTRNIDMDTTITRDRGITR